MGSSTGHCRCALSSTQDKCAVSSPLRRIPPIDRQDVYSIGYFKPAQLVMRWQQLPINSRITCVLDREADFFELFDAHREHARRSVDSRQPQPTPQQDRETVRPIRGSKVQGRMQLTVKRQSARPKRSKQFRRAWRAASALLSLSCAYESTCSFPRLVAAAGQSIRCRCGWSMVRVAQPPKGASGGVVPLTSTRDQSGWPMPS